MVSQHLPGFPGFLWGTGLPLSLPLWSYGHCCPLHSGLGQDLPSTHSVALGWVQRMQRWIDEAPQRDSSKREVALWYGTHSPARTDLSSSFAGWRRHSNWAPKDAKQLLRWRRGIWGSKTRDCTHTGVRATERACGVLRDYEPSGT